MNITLKKLEHQVVVITGATSGIGLTTARLAAKRGAKLVLTARNQDALHQLAEEIKEQGGEAIGVPADVGDIEQVRRVAQEAIARFGRIDTWINNAGVSIYGRYEEVPLEDQRRLFDTNFWGVVHGSLTAVEQMKQQGGALINLGSELSDCAVPLQGMYSASKHAVKGFTDSLRIELETDQVPISVTLIKPAGIDSMFVNNAKNYMDVEPRLPPPVYSTDVAAEAILFAAEHPKRDLFVGGAASFGSAAARAMPRLTDGVLRRFMTNLQQTSMPKKKSDDNLYSTNSILQERSGKNGNVGYVFKSSLYTKAVMHPKETGLAMVGAGLALAALWQSRRAVR